MPVPSVLVTPAPNALDMVWAREISFVLGLLQPAALACRFARAPAVLLRAVQLKSASPLARVRREALVTTLTPRLLPSCSSPHRPASPPGSGSCPNLWREPGTGYVRAAVKTKGPEEEDDLDKASRTKRVREFALPTPEGSWGGPHGGGDQLFFQNGAQYLVADYFSNHPISIGAFSIAMGAARMAADSVWSVLRKGAKEAFSRRPLELIFGENNFSQLVTPDRADAYTSIGGSQRHGHVDPHWSASRLGFLSLAPNKWRDCVEMQITRPRRHKSLVGFSICHCATRSGR